MTARCPMVSVIILNLAARRALLECVASLAEVDYGNFDILVVHNGAEDKTLEKEIRAVSGRVTEVLFSGFNAGFAAGNNIGIRCAMERDVDYILLLNDDTVAAPDFLRLLVEEGERNQAAGMLGPKVYCFDDRRRISFAGAKFDSVTVNFFSLGSDEYDSGEPAGAPFESDYIAGCALLVKRAVAEKIGLLDEGFFLYWEDTDWGLRAKKAGFFNFVVPASRIWHKVSASSGGMDSLIRIYHKTRNHLLMAKLHAPKALPKLHIQFIRDIAWLLFKSDDTNRFKKACAYIAAIKDYHKGKTDKGPQWIWNGYDKN
ncbi:MAG: glycosyltransferase family 2 protein [bacterium]